MTIFSLLQYLFFLIPLSTSSITSPSSSYQPTDTFLINCGSSSNTTDGHRNWIGDDDAKLNFLPPNTANISAAAGALQSHPSAYETPYKTARIFHHAFTYTFGISPGLKFLRLHFYPTTYSGGFDGMQSFFSVTANGYTLLNNFSVFLTVSAAKPPEVVLVKEFIINVESNQILNVTFSPSSTSDSFINGIEIVSMPDDLYFGMHDPSHPIKDLSTSSSILNLDKHNTALETMYRLNVGGGDVPGTADSSGLFRLWYGDTHFLLTEATSRRPYTNISLRYPSTTPAYSAPAIIYTTARDMGDVIVPYNLTWTFPVDPGFSYILRLHFCDFISHGINERVFTIFIGNETAEPTFDIINNSGGEGIPIFRDYVIWVSNPHGLLSKTDLWFAVTYSNATRPVYADAILNGLEIFKLNRSAGYLAGPNPELKGTPQTPPGKPLETKKRNSWATLHPFLKGMAGVAAVILILVLLIFWRRKWMRDTEKSGKLKMTNSACPSLPSDLCRRFLLEELKSATADFDKNFLIGTGGFGHVYKGYIDNGTMTVAIKRLNPSSNQGAQEFRTEIEMLSKLRHLHLVSLIGYCDEHGEMILVYDYMANGTLRDHLYRTNNPPLPWEQRLQICIGAAKGLHYLHTGAEHNIIHRDVKSTNILLDEKWVAKVSDFGLSKVGPTSGIHSHVSTLVKGSVGYVDPEYYKRQRITDKSDVYSFGVVLFEVLCARPALVPNLPKEKVSLAECAPHSYRNGSLEDIIDSNLKGEITQNCLRTYAEIALSCLKGRGIERPTMNDVVWRLEFALQLQETAKTSVHPKNVINPQISLLFPEGEATTTDADKEIFSGSGSFASKSKSKSYSTSTTISCSNGLPSNTVFSEIRNPAGR